MPQSVEPVLWCVVLLLAAAPALPIASVVRHGRAPVRHRPQERA